MTWPFDPLRMFNYDAVVIDPPWHFELRSAKGEEKSPQAQYACMTDEDILGLPVASLIGGAGWVFLWTSAPKLPLGFQCFDRWGVRFVSRMSWRKTTKNDKVRWGPGYVVRSMHEDILIGKVSDPALRKAMPSLFNGLAREHSRKPDEFYALVEGFMPEGSRLADVFSRQSRPGWDVWGDESTKFDRVAA